MKHYLFQESLSALDPEVSDLINLETERQGRKLIMIPSESIAPQVVHQALASSFSHLYAEGYPDERTRRMTTKRILNYESELGHNRRYADPRYYKGVEYANILESLTRRRIAELFATPDTPAKNLYVNVQALSGVPANTAVQYAVMDPGDTMLSMALHVGGHLSHGSKVAYSGKTFKIVHYTVDEKTERLDYDIIRDLALQTRPKVIIGGYTSYPWAPDWKRFREIADEVGAFLLADIAHVAGLTIAGAYPSPVGIADAITLTTHKNFNGPRGAVIITHKADVGKKIDRAVFPGLQGGPHMENIAGIAVAAHLAGTEQFRELQYKTVENATALAKALSTAGIRVAYGGTDTHLLLIDCKTVTGPDGTPLMGDPAARILDIAGVVANRNTIPGDTTALYPSGVRLGTPWVTQRGLDRHDMEIIAKAMARIFNATKPYVFHKRNPRYDYRARVDFDVLESVKGEIAALAAKAQDPYTHPTTSGYPHFYTLGDKPKGNGKFERLELVGTQVQDFVDGLTPSNTKGMAVNEQRSITLLEVDGTLMSPTLLTRVSSSVYYLDVPILNTPRVMTWLRALVDGYVATDDVYGRLPFLDAVRDLGPAPDDVEKLLLVPQRQPFDKPYFIGAWSCREAGDKVLLKFAWQASGSMELRKTLLNSIHREMGARMVPFGGWDMPVWYTSNSAEHRAVRQAAGLFDVSHMGCWDVRGSEAAAFLNLVMVNDISLLAAGQSQYTALFDVDGIPLDDLIVYHLAEEHFLVVVNAANNDKDWAWVNAVLNGETMIDPQRPWVKWDAPPGTVILRDLRNTSAGDDMRMELALQGPKARAILLTLGGSITALSQIKSLPWAGITHVNLGEFDVIVSRTGYTGERIAYELFVHPDQLEAFWKKLLTVGEPLGMAPCGLAARDSLRTEAGLPLYGHEMEGPLNLTMADAGFGTYVKLYKPFFIGRQAYITRESQRDAAVVRFRIKEKGQPMPQQLDPVVDSRGKVIGKVTSCAIDTEGFLLGQAYIRRSYAKRGTNLAVLVTPHRQPKPQAELEMGDRASLPIAIVVLPRFPW